MLRAPSRRAALCMTLVRFRDTVRVRAGGRITRAGIRARVRVYPRPSPTPSPSPSPTPTPKQATPHFESLQAFWPALQVLAGDVDEGAESFAGTVGLGRRPNPTRSFLILTLTLTQTLTLTLTRTRTLTLTLTLTLT